MASSGSGRQKSHLLPWLRRSPSGPSSQQSASTPLAPRPAALRAAESLLHPHSAAGCGDKSNHEALGLYLSGLTEDTGWIKRRVETVEFLDLSRRERRVTLDVSWYDLQRRASEAGLSPRGKLPMVVTTLPKGLLLDVDLLGEHGRPMPVLTSDQDSFASQLIIARQYLLETGIPLDAADLEEAYGYCRDFESTPGAFVARLATPAPLTAQKLSFFADNFLMMTELEPAAPTFILKFRVVESHHHDRRAFTEALSLRSQALFVDAPGIASSQREHLRIVAPPGLFIESEQIYLDEWQGPPPARPYTARIAPERAVVYTTGLPRDDYFLMVTMRPTPNGSFTAAALWIIASFAIASCGLVGDWIGGILTGNHASRLEIGPLLAVLLSISSLGAANVLRSDEHEMSRSVASPLRALVLFATGVTVTASLSVVLNGWDSVIRTSWILAVAVTAIATGLISCSWANSWLRYRDVRRDHNATVARQVEPID